MSLAVRSGRKWRSHGSKSLNTDKTTNRTNAHEIKDSRTHGPEINKMADREGFEASSEQRAC
jgi:hypothetical protein